jgi:hypothetical protein
MAEQIAHDEFMVVDQYDISGCSSNFGFEHMVDLEEVTTFPSVTQASDLVYKRRLPGVVSAKASVAGYLDMAVSHAALSAAFGASPVIMYGLGRALGSQVYMFVGKEGSLSYGGPVGKAIPITADLSSDGLITPGELFEFGAKTATGNGTSRTISTVTSGKKRVLHVHVPAISGTLTPTMTVIYETSAIGDYTDAVTRHTFTNFTAVGKQRAILSSAVTDTNGRFRWTITGTTPSFLVLMGEGVK